MSNLLQMSIKLQPRLNATYPWSYLWSLVDLPVPLGQLFPQLPSCLEIVVAVGTNSDCYVSTSNSALAVVT